MVPLSAAGRIELVAAQASGGNLVRVFTIEPDAGDPVVDGHTRQFRPFGQRVTSGTRLATADIGTVAAGGLVSVESDGVHEIVAASGAGPRGTVTVMQAVAPVPATVGTFQPFTAGFRGGVHVARLPGTPATADRILVSGGRGSGSQVETWRHDTIAPGGFVREAAFTAFGDGGAAVVAAAFDDTAIYSVEILGSTGMGVRRTTTPGGGVHSTVPSTAGVVASQRLAVTGLRPADGSIRFATDFTTGVQGWKAGVVDRPAVTDIDYQLDAGLRDLPAEVGSGTGFMLQGMNRSDDLFLYVTRQLTAADGILADTDYELSFTITLASNAPTGSFGVGGSPGESVWLKAGGSTSEPTPVIDAENWLRLDVDKGNQSQGGKAATVAGTIGNGTEPTQGVDWPPYVSIIRQVTHAASVTSDAHGRLWLLVGIDSGYEGFTRIYLERIAVHLTRR